ncbi:MAG: hypothetical protein LH606_15410 [Cytophagaceae bacterium]|nr:hypothetical protein [Cytophagaceae bacterium]
MIPQPIPFDTATHQVQRDLFFEFIFRNTTPGEFSTDKAGNRLISVEAVQRLTFDAQTPETFADGLRLTLLNYRALPENYAEFDGHFTLKEVAGDFSQMELNRLCARPYLAKMEAVPPTARRR